MSVPVVGPLARRAAELPVVTWFALAVVLALAVLVWHRYCLDPEDRDWLDPGQPPINVDLDMKATVAGVLPTQFRALKPYHHDSLSAHPGCWVGDC